MKVWILTSEHNDYDQHGEYFLAVFKDKPFECTYKDLTKEYNVSYSTISRILNNRTYQDGK